MRDNGKRAPFAHLVTNGRVGRVARHYFTGW
jgi:hypothetical protein